MIRLILNVVNKLRRRESFVKRESFLADVLFCDHFSVPIVNFVSKYRIITPNIITILALFVSLIAIYFYCIGGHKNLLIGGLVFYFADILDGVDGKLARKINIKSEFGAKLDRYSDSFRKALALGSLIFSDLDHNKYILILLVLVHYLLNYIRYEPNMIHIKQCRASGLKSIYQPWDAMFLLLVIGPLFNSFYHILLLTIALQIIKILFHKYLGYTSQLLYDR